ncbi:MAG TPA: AsmA-like C-terminal region-containing protein [Bryobacteraceae bacterium]|nr:AsmA-like C-terminal region-containing protein [Bryobacteraceae bacterium]
MVQWVAGIAAVILFLAITAVLGLIAARPWIDSALRQRMVSFLDSRFESKTELRAMRLSWWPHLTVAGEGLAMRKTGRTDLPPLIAIQRFQAEASLLGLLRSHVQKVLLVGLQIHMPPRQSGDNNQGVKAGKSSKASHDIVVDEIDADGALLQILPKQAGKAPLEFDLRKLQIHSASATQPMSFEAALTNPKPPGLIQTEGKFGPWQKDDPGATPISGRYTFEHADLSIFHGIAGILSSEGQYQGALNHIEVNGTTDTPDFSVRVSGNPVHLKTQFHSIVDGTDGNTWLQPVVAEFLNSKITARGGVVGTKGVKGRTVMLDVDVEQARLEDLLRLAVKSAEPPMTGDVKLRTKLKLPPGKEGVPDKLFLDGRISVKSGQFTKFSVQEKVDALSRHASGHPNSEPDRVVSDLAARFVLSNGVLAFSSLTFAVPGAQVALHGTYGLYDEKFDLHGQLRLQAKLSETTSGWKSFLLKLTDPFFEKRGVGAVVPIAIGGTRTHPSFKLEIGGSSAKQTTK